MALGPLVVLGFLTRKSSCIRTLGIPRIKYGYRNDPKFSDRYAWANSADPDQTAPRGAGAV